MDVDARIEALQEENDRLHARLATLEATLGHTFRAPIEWMLTAHECRLFGSLLSRDLCTKDALMAALYRDLGREEADIKIVDVYVCKLRKKLKPFGIPIETRWGEGYYLAPATKAAVRETWLQQAAA